MTIANDDWFHFLWPVVKTKRDGNQWLHYEQATQGGFPEGGIQGPIILPAGMELWKVTSFDLKEGDELLSEWWSAKTPFKEQTTDLQYSIEEAALNGIPLHVYVRIAGCVRVEWNTLNKLQIIRLKKSVKALWGEFREMPVTKADEIDSRFWGNENEERLNDMKKRGYDPDTGDAILGGMGAHQLYIPGLRGTHVELIGEVGSEDTEGIKKLLGIKDLPKGPTDLNWFRHKESNWVRILLTKAKRTIHRKI